MAFLLIFSCSYDTINAVVRGAVLYSFRFSENLEELKWDSQIQEKA
jgi:hypothetical protein